MENEVELKRKKHGCQHEPPCAGTMLVSIPGPPVPVVVETLRGFEVWPGEPEDNKIIATFSELEDANLFVAARAAATHSSLLTDEREIEAVNARHKTLEEDLREAEAELVLRGQRISQLQALHSNDTEDLQREVERLRKDNEEAWNTTIGIVRAKFEVCDTLNAEAAGPLKQALKTLEAARQSRERLT